MRDLHPHPASAPPSLTSVFVGRERELSELVTAYEDVEAGRGRLFLICGDPGIGKSRLADQFGTEVAARGARVLWGRCWEAGGAPAYWPWTQSLRSYVRDAELDRLRTEVGPGAPDLARVIPDLRTFVPDIPDPPASNPEAARFRLFDSVAAFLWNASRSGPLVIVIDDLHAADAPSLLLLRFLASELGRARVMVIGSYRDTEIAHNSTLAETVSELTREPSVRRMQLAGLTESAVAELIAKTAGLAPPAKLVTAVHSETGGNPLFVGEIVRLLATEGRLDHAENLPRLLIAVPEEISSTIGRRLDHLSRGCVETLMLASVLGREFDLKVLEVLTGSPSIELLKILEEAVTARVVSDVPGSPGRSRFAHALIRDTLYDRIGGARRADLHAKVGDALERLHQNDLEQHLAEIAGHFFEAAPTGDAERALAYAERAATSAVTRLAYEEAARLLRMALSALELQSGPNRVRRCELLLGLGDALLKAGDYPRAKDTFLEAAAIARDEVEPNLLARAALGYGGRFVWMRAGSDRDLIPILREALDALDDDDSPLRVRLLARLAGAMRDQSEREPREAVSRQAVEMARRLGEPETLAYALVSRYAANWGPETAEEQLDIAEELTELARAIGDRDREVEGHFIRAKSLLTLGRMSGVYEAMEDSARLAADLRQPSQQWYAAVDRAVLALLEGRFKAAERLIPELLRLGQRALGMDTEVAYRLQTFMLRKERGGLEELEEPIRRSISEYPWYPMFRCVLANLYAELGRTAEARAELEEIATDGFSTLPRDNAWLFALSWLPEVIEFLGDTTRAEQLHDLLLPYGHLNAYSPPELCTGSVVRCLGILAATAGRFDQAESHFEDALDAHARMRARPWLVHTQYDYARMLLRRDGEGDRAKADRLLADAFASSCEVGMTVLAGKISAIRERAEPAAHAAATGAFQLEGDFWSLAYEGKAFRLRDAKGLRYIHRLLREPGREFHVAELTAAPDAGDAGPVIDARAKAEYGRRIENLRDEMEEASAWGDQDRAARAQEEIDAIASALAAAYGLGGRERRGADSAERIRKAVTNRIRVSLARIGEQNPELSRHLANSITTGTFCSYGPDREVLWRL